MLVTFLLQLFIITLMLSISFQLTAQQLFRTLHKSRLIISSLLVNILFIPCTTLFFIHMIDLPKTTEFTLLLASVAPGAAFAPKLVAIACGDLASSVGLTFILSILATIIVPLTIQMAYFNKQSVSVNVIPVVWNLVLFQLLPLLIGFAIRSKNTLLAKRLLSSMETFSDILFALILVVVLFKNFDVLFSIGWLSLGAIIIFNIMTLVIGWRVGNFEAGTQKSLTLTTASRNLALILLVAIEIFPQSEIEATVTAFGLVEITLTLLVSFYFRRSYFIENNKIL